MSEECENRASVITGKNIDLYRMITLLRGLGVEITGMRLSRHINCYAVIKKEFGLKGTKKKVHEEFSKIVTDAKEGMFPEGYIIKANVGSENSEKKEA